MSSPREREREIPYYYIMTGTAGEKLIDYYGQPAGKGIATKARAGAADLLLIGRITPPCLPPRCSPRQRLKQMQISIMGIENHRHLWRAAAAAAVPPLHH